METVNPGLARMTKLPSPGVGLMKAAASSKRLAYQCLALADAQRGERGRQSACRKAAIG